MDKNVASYSYHMHITSSICEIQKYVATYHNGIKHAWVTVFKTSSYVPYRWLTIKEAALVFALFSLISSISVATHLKVGGPKSSRKATFIMIYSNIFSYCMHNINYYYLNLYYITTKSKITIVMPTREVPLQLPCNNIILKTSLYRHRY